MPLDSIPPSAEATVKVGDIFYCSWGYDQTNIDFYQVVELSASGKTAKLREIGKTFVNPTGGPIEHVSAVKDDFTESHEQHWCVHCRGGLRTSSAGKLVHRQTDDAQCIDDEGRYTGESAAQCAPTIHTRRVQYYGNEPHFSFENHYASRWDGTPKYQTGVGYGH
jgi:hypothetical protein